MIPPDRETLMAIIRLQSDQNFARVLLWMKLSLDMQSRDNNHVVDRDVSNQNKGRGLELEDLLTRIDNAETDLKRQQEPKKGLV